MNTRNGAIHGECAYDIVFDIGAYMKRKRKKQMVILADSLLPRPCAVCGSPIDPRQGNRTDIYPGPQPKVVAMHYECSWKALFTDLEALAEKLEEAGML